MSISVPVGAVTGVYDVRILWAAAAEACPLVAGQFDAVADDRRSPSAPAPVTLGRTHVVSLPAGHIPIQMHRGATGGLIGLLRAENPVRLTGHPVPSPDDIGRALGRVLAQEIGQVRLGADWHRRSGLMRARFLAQDLIAPAVELPRDGSREVVDADRIGVHREIAAPDNLAV